MTGAEKIFTITEARHCPLYERGDRFTLSGLSFQAPQKKPVCLLLARVIDESVLTDMQPAASGSREVFNCPGCSGLIKLSREDGKKYQTVQRQLLANWQNRNKQPEVGALTGALSSFTFFKALDEESLKDIIAQASMMIFAPNDIILRQGQPGRNLFVILSGRVALVNRQHEAIATLGRGELFGEMSLLSGDPVSITVMAAEEVRCLTITADNLRAILQRYPFLQMAFTRLLVQRLAVASASLLAGDSPEITGELTAVSLAELFRMLHENGKNGLILLDFSGQKAKVAFRDGEIIFAEHRGAQGRDALLLLVGEKKGRFRFTSKLPERIAEAESIGAFFDLLSASLSRLDDPEQS